MNISYIILGVGMICVGILIIILQLKWLKKGIKDRFGYQGRMLLGGVAFVIFGIFLLVKYW